MGLVSRAAIVLLLLGACFSKPPRPGDEVEDAKPLDDSPTADGWLPGYGFRKRVTVTTGIQSTLTTFPVGISRTDPDIAARADEQGRDLVATTDDGTTPLAIEIAFYNAGTMELWVRMPTLGAQAAFYLYYGGNNAPVSTVVWDGPFAGVWHLSEPVAGSARDSTDNENSLNATGDAVPAMITNGVFGPARSLDGNDQLNGGDPGGNDLDFGTASFSFSLWVNQTAAIGDFDTPFYKGGPSAGEPGYCFLLGSTAWAAKITDNDGSNGDPEMVSIGALQGRWVHLAAIVDREADSFTFFADTTQAETQSLSGRMIGDLSTIQPIQIGRGTTEPFAGLVDEVRIYRGALTLDWITAEVNNGTDPGFIAFGDEESKP